MPRASRGTARERWRRIIAAQEGSGQSIAAFCRESGASAPQFFYWKRQLRAAGGAPAPGFIELRVREAGPVLEVRLRGGRVLSLQRGVDLEWVRQVAAALEGGE
jgi:transposase-like protein